jgi:uncharacterized oligopeptide transporter (OPT) family protein
LILVSMAAGFVLGLAVGCAIAWYSIDWTVVIPLRDGVKAQAQKSPHRAGYV